MTDINDATAKLSRDLRDLRELLSPISQALADYRDNCIPEDDPDYDDEWRRIQRSWTKIVDELYANRVEMVKIVVADIDELDGAGYSEVICANRLGDDSEDGLRARALELAREEFPNAETIDFKVFKVPMV